MSKTQTSEPPAPSPTVVAAIHRLLEGSRRPFTTREITDALKGTYAPSYVQKAISLMWRATPPLLQQIQEGLYELPEGHEVAGGQTNQPGAGGERSRNGAASASGRPSGTGAQPASVLEYPVAPHGHGAGEVGRDNGDGAPPRVTIPAGLMRRWTGGHVPIQGLWTFAAGTSMEPHIPNGYPVFIEPVTEFVDGERYAVWLGEAEADVIKRVSVEPGGSIVLSSDNPLVRPRRLWPTDDPTVWRVGSEETAETIRCVLRGRIVLPLDTPAALSAYVAREISNVVSMVTSALARP